MALIEINRDPTTREIRQFALLWLPALCFLTGGWLGYRQSAWSAAAGLAGCGVLSIVVGVWWPRCMRLVLIG